MRPALRGAVRGIVLAAFPVTSAAGQIDRERATAYFREVAELCAKDAGRQLGVSLCGPMVFADPRTRDIVANEPTPSAPRPPALGFANAALQWGDRRWSILVWQGIPAGDAKRRKTMLIHELVHRVQPQLGLLLPDANNDHLDTVDGRFWLQLEWRALGAALRATGEARRASIGDALAFRRKRHELFSGAQETERVLEINEGMPQYVATAIVSGTGAEAAAHAVEQLEAAPRNNATLVRTFPYPAGAAYGVLLEAYSPGWTRRLKKTDDLSAMLGSASGVAAASDATALASRYGGDELRAAEVRRDEEHRAHLAELRKKFVEGPRVILPNGRMNTFVTNGMTPIPGEGMLYPAFRTTGDWGSVEAAFILMSADRARLILPGPPQVNGDTATGDRWTLKIATGWALRPSDRAGDVRLVKEP